VRRALAAAVVVLAACARPVPGPAGRDESPVARGVIVTLRWTAPVDLDLYVTDPTLETVYFANPRTASGGVLERDARCADRQPGERVERARWTRPPPGKYRVGVDYLETCAGRASEAEYALRVDVDGQRREITGRARRAEREPLVLEFTVAAPAAGEER